MRNIQLLFFATLLMYIPLSLFGQQGGGENNKEYLPGAIYEIRYWTNMASMGDQSVYIDTMIFFNNDRAVFEYSNQKCVSYHCRDTDSLVYVLLPKFKSSEKEWIMGENFVRKLYETSVPFRGYERTIYKLFGSDMKNKGTGLGNYALVSKQFGIIYRYNTEGEVYMLNRIDVLQDGKVMDEIDLLPMQMKLQETDIFTGGY